MDAPEWPPRIDTIDATPVANGKAVSFYQGLGGCLVGFIGAVILELMIVQVQVLIGLPLPGTFVRRMFFSVLAWPLELIFYVLAVRKYRVFAITFLLFALLTTALVLILVHESFLWSDLFGFIASSRFPTAVS